MQQNHPPKIDQGLDRRDATRPDDQRPRNTQQAAPPFADAGITTEVERDDGAVHRHEIGGELKLKMSSPWYDWPLRLFVSVVGGLLLIWLTMQPEVQEFLANVRPWIENAWRKLTGM